MEGDQSSSTLSNSDYVAFGECEETVDTAPISTATQQESDDGQGHQCRKSSDRCEGKFTKISLNEEKSSNEEAANRNTLVPYISEINSSLSSTSKASSNLIITQSQEDFEKIKTRDIAFIVMFIIHLAVLIIFALNEGRFVYDVDGSNSQGVYIRLDFKSVMTVITAGFVVSFVLAASSLNFLLKHTMIVLNIAISINIILPIIIIFVGLALENITVVVISTLYMFYSLFLCSRRISILDFTGINFELALLAIKEHLSLLGVAALSVVVLFLWTFFFSLIVVGVINETTLH